MDPTPAQTQRPRGERLHSWKEIAAYLKRDIRTVQRWERQEALPVHRHLHDERGTAYAYAGEIDEWLERRTRRDDKEGSSAGLAAPGSAGPAATATPRRTRWLQVLGAVAILGGMGLVALWVQPRGRSEPPPLSSLAVVFSSSERVREWGPDFAFSPDGTTLVYTEVSGQLHLRRLDQLASHALGGTERSWGPFFSPDGRWIGFNRAGELMKISIDGGAPVALGIRAPFMGSADWGSDDHIVYASTTPDGRHGLYRVPSQGGTPQLIATLEGSADDAYWLTPQSLSDGTVILCTVARVASSRPRFEVVAVRVSTGERRLLVDDARHGQYVGDGVLAYLRNGSLFATRLNLDRLEVSGPDVPAWEAVWERVRMRSWTAAAGTLVYWPTGSTEHRLAWVSRDGRQELLPLPPAMYHAPRVSPDGKRIAYHTGSDFGDVWTFDLTTGASVRVTTDSRSAVPLWSPDGAGLIVSRLHASGRTLARISLSGPTGTEAPELLHDFPTGAFMEPSSWADGGRTLIARDSAPSARPALWAVPLDGRQAAHPLAPDTATHGRVSPDGRWLVYAAPGPQGQRSEVYVTSYPTGRQHWKVSENGGTMPTWSRSGREVFYRQGDAIMAVAVDSGDTFMPARPRQLFEVPWYEAEPGSPNYDVSPDDQRFLMVLPAREDGPERLNVIQGWKADLLRRLRQGR